MIEDDDSPAPNITIESHIATPKRYAHQGKRRRRYTEELFRCQFVDMISRTPLVCNSLLWRNKLPELRNHLAQHLEIDIVAQLSDSEVLNKFDTAKSIYTKDIPEGIDDECEDDDEDYPDLGFDLSESE